MLKRILKTGQLRAWSLYKEQLRKEHKLNYLFWECTLNCNFYCAHCGSNAGKKVHTNELTTAEIKKTFFEIAQDYDAKKIMIAITGGEPLLRQDIFEVMSYAKKLGFSWGMVTNGFLVDEQVVCNMQKSGMDTVVVSIDGIGKIHDDFRNVSGAYEHAVNAVKLLAKADFLKDLQITTSVHQGNIDNLEKMYETFLPLGITSWRVMNIDPIGRAENNKLLLTPEQLKQLLDFIKIKRKQNKKVDITYGCAGFLGLDYEREVRRNFFICNTGINTGSILHNGDIFVCPNVPRLPELIQGNVRKDRFSEIWNNKFAYFRNPDRTACVDCKKCDFWPECKGGSMHIWDFTHKKPKMCHYQQLDKK
ncbi:MAG: radical SAM protein [Patescibacteria group bacterium]